MVIAFYFLVLLDFSSFTARAPQETETKTDDFNSKCIGKYKTCSTCMVMPKFTCRITSRKDRKRYQDYNVKGYSVP